MFALNLRGGIIKYSIVPMLHIWRVMSIQVWLHLHLFTLSAAPIGLCGLHAKGNSCQNVVWCNSFDIVCVCLSSSHRRTDKHTDLNFGIKVKWKEF